MLILFWILFSFSFPLPVLFVCSPRRRRRRCSRVNQITGSITSATPDILYLMSRPWSFHSGGKITTVFEREKNRRLWKQLIRGPSLFLTRTLWFERESIRHLNSSVNRLLAPVRHYNKKQGRKNSLQEIGIPVVDLVTTNPGIWITVKLVARRLSRCNTLAGFCYNWPVSLAVCRLLFTFDSGQLYNDVWSSF